MRRLRSKPVTTPRFSHTVATRRTLLPFVCLLALALGGCGIATGTGRDPGSPSAAPSSATASATTPVPDADAAQGPSQTANPAMPTTTASGSGAEAHPDAAEKTALADKYGLTSASPRPPVTIPDLGMTQKPLPDADGLAFVAGMGPGWNLGNTFDAIDGGVTDELSYETLWSGAATTRELIRAVREKGFRTLRLPVSWHNHVSGEDHVISKAWLDRVQEVVDWALAEDMVVILNIHHDNNPDFLYPDTAHYAASAHYMERIWTQLAARFGDYDERLVFEAMNEPRLSESATYAWWISTAAEEGVDAVDCINRLNQLFVDTIRASGKTNRTRWLMVPGYCASPQFAVIPEFTLPTDAANPNGSRIMVSAHAYTPYAFALQAPAESGGTDRFKISSAYFTKDIDAALESLYKRYTSQGIPVVIGEFGSRAKGENLQDRVEHAAYFAAAARIRGMTCVWWDNNAFSGDGEIFGLIDRASLTWRHEPIADAIVRYAGSPQTGRTGK